MASKVKKVKWAISGEEPEDLVDFKDNEQIIKENKGKLPPKGVYNFLVRRIGVKPNKNGDDRLNVMFVLDEPKKSSAASWNGLVMWDGYNVTEQGKPWINRFLKGLGLTWKQFLDSTTEEEDGDKRQIVQIGKVKIGGDKPPKISVLTKVAPADDYNDSDYITPARFIPKGDGESDDSDDGADEGVDMSADSNPKKSKKDKAKPEPEPEPKKAKGKKKKVKDEPPF